MTFLLDVNVLIALIDPIHTQHDAVHAWFAKKGRKTWATCPITENGVLRIVAHPRYPNSLGTPESVKPLMVDLCALPGHVFWPDDISILDRKRFNTACLLNSGQITDSYLLALACAHRGQLATFDQRLITGAVRDGAQHVHWINEY